MKAILFSIAIALLFVSCSTGTGPETENPSIIITESLPTVPTELAGFIPDRISKEY